MKDNRIKKQLNPEKWVDLYGDYLFRYALFRVNNKNVAEDIVQETFLSALKASDNFKFKSTEKTWLTSILRFKIIDHFRQKGKENTIIADNENKIDKLFNKKGKWNVDVPEWRFSAQELFEKKEFMNVFNLCISKLKGKTAYVFHSRELDGEKTETICKDLKITATNCWVMLHRARQNIRYCLEKNWFDKKEEF